ncbi:hypothetical protein A8F94_10920 [Bacillus sp. FJAT-27225]|uniref:acyltransferase family protein n=1 Tax=Bacillus sp. FJAT-27225 TaxID=1743144 RepID=UPI00080C3056|nr:acyltransferase family protein [Bacillus sp. FJAT-27225]OCA88300.1 hypothetical protein A8F94_10920 [Bacillus sp. FJAT-27225]
MAYNHTIDKLKFLAAIAVVLIHTTGSIKQFNLDTLANYHIYRPVLDIAVPFFFAASGYFLSHKSASYIPGYVKKISYIYISFTLFYIFYKLLIILSDRLVLNTPFWVNFHSVIKGLTIKGFLNGTLGSFHLWYLPALILAALLLLICLKFALRPSIVFLAAGVLYVAFLTGIVTFNNVFVYGGFAKGFFYLAMGYYLGKKNIEHLRNPLLGFAVAVILYTYLSYYHYNLNVIFLGAATYYLMVFAIRNPGKRTFLSGMGPASLNIYILHVFVYQTINKLYIYGGSEDFYRYPSYYAIVIFAAVILPIFIFKPVDKLWSAPVSKWMYNLAK